MKSLVPYLFFNGNCKAAMEFYRDALDGKLEIFTTGASNQPEFKDQDPNLVLNSTISAGPISFMASDSLHEKTKGGENVYLYLDCASRTEVDKLYGALSKGGTADMKPQDHFWGAYMGSLTDAFGVCWMVNCSSRL